MQIQEAVQLIRAAQLKNTPCVWADLGCGSGIFSLALSHLLVPQSKIYAVDQTPQQLQAGAAKGIDLLFHQANFEKDGLPFANLDGIIIANALHYVKDKLSFLHKAKGYLSPNGSFIIVEYDTLQANQWVPYPINFLHLKSLFSAVGYGDVSKLGERPSVYRSGNMYACQLMKAESI
jgi:ubiquinone/menaquinone biosynthesis C-methylase UbiE